MLNFEVREPAVKSEAAPLIVLMHGRGATRSDLVPLGAHMPDHACVVFPEAPFDAAPWGYGPGSAWYQFLGRNRPEPKSFSGSIDALQVFIAGLQKEYRIDAARIIVGGFSQGGTLGLGYALANPGSVRGVLNFSGFLADHPRVVVNDETVKDLAIFWGHGRGDPAITYQLAIEGREQLRAVHANLTARDYDIGHWIDPEELRDAVAWVNSVL